MEIYCNNIFQSIYDVASATLFIKSKDNPKSTRYRISFLPEWQKKMFTQMIALADNEWILLIKKKGKIDAIPMIS